MAAIDYADNFQRADGPLGLTSTGAKAWRVDSGSGQISAGRAVINGIATTDAEVADVDATLTVQPGASLIFRAVDSSNHWRLRAISNTTSTQVPRYGTEYLWTYGPSYDSTSAVIQHDHSTSGSVWAVSNPGPRTISHSHPHANVTLQTHSHTDNPVRGESRQTIVGYDTVYSTTYAFQLERVTAGAVAAVRSANVPSIGAARVVTRPTGEITAFNGGTQLFTLTDPALAAATRVGASGTVDNLTVAVLIKPPGTPTGLVPNGAATVDTSSTVRFEWQHIDTDRQASYSLRLRPVGAADWTVLSGGADQFRTLSPGTLVPGDYEWDVTTTDSTGLTSPTSARAFFTASTPPGTPTITSPAAGGTVGGSEHAVTWTAASQEAYQLRLLTDNAGEPGTVLFDTGTVVEAGTRSRTTAHLTNGRVEHVQVRVRNSGLWSGWASVRYTVTYTPPPAASGLLDNTAPWMRVLIENPPPAAGQPVVARNDLYRRPRGSTDPVGLRVAASLGINEVWADPHLAHLEDVEYRVVAYGVNGTAAEGAWFDTLAAAPVVSTHPEGDYLDADYYVGDYDPAESGAYTATYESTY